MGSKNTNKTKNENETYERAVAGVPYAPDTMQLHNVARKIDELRSQIVEDSRRMATEFSRFASSIARGEFRPSPTGSSAIRDIEVANAKLEILRGVFDGMIASRPDRDAIRAALAAAHFSDDEA